MEKDKKTKKTGESVRKRIIRISNLIRLGKEGKNAFGKYNYFRPDDIMTSLNPLLEEYNLIAVFQMKYSVEKDMYEGNLRIEDCDEPRQKVEYFFDIPLTQVAGASQAQNSGATQTYCKRYMLMNAFNIADNSIDPDAGKPVAQGDPNELASPKQLSYLKQLLTKSGVKEEQKQFEKLSIILNNLITDWSEIKKPEASRAIEELVQTKKDEDAFLSNAEEEGKQEKHQEKIIQQ